MSTTEDERQLLYDAGEHRKKHCWNQPYPDVVKNGSTFVGKCPSTLSKEEARILLDDAEYDGKVEGESAVEVLPKRMWNVHQSVVYEAVPTQPGVSYHGYPWLGRPGRNRLPRVIRAALARRAEEQGFKREFDEWMATYEG